MQCILQLEYRLTFKRFYFLVQYFTHEVYEFASAILIDHFLDPPPNMIGNSYNVKKPLWWCLKQQEN